MVEMRMHDAAQPAQAMVADASALRYVVDAKGRRIGWRPLNVLEEMDFYELAGKSADNARWSLFALAACMTFELDGVKLSRPATRPQLMAAVQRLDREGVQAVVDAINAENPEEKEAAQVASAGE